MKLYFIELYKWAGCSKLSETATLLEHKVL